MMDSASLLYPPTPPEAPSLGVALSRPVLPPIVLPTPTPARLFAPRSIFFTIPLRDPRVGSSPIAPVQPIIGLYLDAINRVNNAPERDGNRLGLDLEQRSAIIALLTVLNDYHPHHPLTVTLTTDIASNTDVMMLSNYGNLIHRGLAAFQSKNTTRCVTVSSTLVGSAESRRSPYAFLATTQRRRADVSAPAPTSSSRSSRSTAARASCRTRDSERCRICDDGQAVSVHIIPFSLHDSKALDFWKFVAMVCGEAATEQMKQFALEPEATNTDNILNMLCLCRNCRHLYDHAAITLVPDLDAPAVAFPYSPWSQSAYDVTVEFPGGCNHDVRVLAESDAGVLYRITPGHRLHWSTDDPDNFPLPHPLLLQLHVVCSRMAKIRAAAGWRSELGGSEGGQTVWEDLEVEVEEEQDTGKECMVNVVVQEEMARDSSAAVVAKELEMREMERRMLWAEKMQGMEMLDVGGVVV